MEELLDDENILGEFKSLNDKLLEYMTDDKIKTLLRYVVEEPPQDADRNRGHKYPFTSCEILTAEVQTILSAFFGQNPNSLKKEDTSSDFDKFQKAPSTSDDKEENKEGSDNGEPSETTQEKKDTPTDTGAETGEKVTPPEEQAAPPKEPETKLDEEIKEPADKISENKDSGKESHTPRSSYSDTSDTKTDKKMELANYFFNFLSKPNLNITLVGYFCRVLSHIILKKPTEMIDFLYKNPEILDRFTTQLQYRNVAECFSRILAFENSLNTEPRYLDIRKKLVSKLIDFYTQETEDERRAEELSNVSYVLSELISKLNSTNGGKELLEYVTGEEILDPLFKNLCKTDIRTNHIATVVNSFLNFFIQNKKSLDGNASDSQDENKESLEITETESNKFLKKITDSIRDISGYLDEETGTEYTASFGGRIQPLGTTKLKLIEILLYAIKLNNVKINREIALQKVYQRLMKLLMKYEWNNILHNFVEKIFITTLEGDSHVLKKALLHESELMKFFEDSTKEADYTIPNAQKRKIRKGYLGHITKIAIALPKLKEKDSEIATFLETAPWKDFNEKYLQNVLKQDNYDLAGIKKDASEEDPDEIGNVHFDSEIQRKFNDFSFQNIGTNNKDDEEEIEEKEDFDDDMDRDNKDKEPEGQVIQNIDNVDDPKNEGIWVVGEAKEDNAKAHTDKSLWGKTSSNLSEMKLSEEDHIRDQMNSPVKELKTDGDTKEENCSKKYYDNQFWNREYVTQADSFLEDLLKK
jgi:hypothetical protein